MLNNTRAFEEAADRFELDPICGSCLSNLKTIVDETGCEIVLSSAWRLNASSIKKLRLSFHKVGLPHKFRMTPELRTDRHFEIEKFLGKVEKPTLVVVLDDLADAGIVNVPTNVKEIFLQTLMEVGLDLTTTQKAIEFFNSHAF